MRIPTERIDERDLHLARLVSRHASTQEDSGDILVAEVINVAADDVVLVGPSPLAPPDMRLGTPRRPIPM